MLNTSSRYDVIVVGAGLEGLLCAALLSKRGKRVIVLEGARVAGGASSRVSKDGHVFIKGPSLFLGFEKDGLYERIFTELGLSLSLLKQEGDLLQRKHPPLQIILPGHRLDFFTDQPAWHEELKREFPDQVRELKAFWAEMERWEEIIRPRMHQAYKAKLGTIRDILKEFRRWMRYSSAVRKLKKWNGDTFIRKHKLSPEIRRGLELLLLSFLGKTMAESTGLELVHLLGLVQREMITVRGGIPRLSELLVGMIEENKGEVVLGRPIAELIVRRRTPDGVRMVDGEAIHGDSIILNFPWHSASEAPSARQEFSLYFAVSEKVIPEPMKDHLFLLRSFQKESVSDNYLYIQMNSAEINRETQEGFRPLRVTGYLPETDRPRRDVLKWLVQDVTAHLLWLIPFSDGVLTFLGDDLGDMESTTRIPLKLAEQAQVSKQVTRNGACYYLTRLKNLYLLPDLGRHPAATLESPRSVLEVVGHILKMN